MWNNEQPNIYTRIYIYGNNWRYMRDIDTIKYIALRDQ